MRLNRVLCSVQPSVISIVVTETLALRNSQLFNLVTTFGLIDCQYRDGCVVLQREPQMAVEEPKLAIQKEDAFDLTLMSNFLHQIVNPLNGVSGTLDNIINGDVPKGSELKG